MRFFALLAAFLTLCLASQSFRCSFTMRSPAMTSGGYVSGTMKYDWATNKMLLNSYTSSGAKELYSYNPQGGYNTAALKPYDAQFEFSFGSACTNCNTASLVEVMPILFKDTTYLNLKSGNTYTPKATTSPMAQVTFDAAGYPTEYRRSDGRVYTYTGCTDATFTKTADFSTPSDCSCGKPINVVLVLDRSSSIDKSEFALEKDFTQKLVAGFTYSSTGVNLGITNFHTISWDGPINLLQGNNQASVAAGASALQCAPDGQCKVFSSAGTCCGMGTSISSGVVNGADMLAGAVASQASGFRATAANVMIVLTDGYHNKVLKKKSDNSLDRDADGKPQGVPFSGTDGKSCSEAGEATCRAGLLSDLDYAVSYAVSKVPRLQILSVGVGTVWDQEQLLHIANGVAANVFGTDDWNKLATLVDDLVSMTCQGGAVTPCTGCCGFCSCQGCTAVDGCDTGNFCDDITKVAQCCKATPKAPGACDKADKCFTYSCDRAASNGAGACAQTAKPVQASDNCNLYKCNPASGLVEYTDLCPPQPACKVDTDCNDKLACTTDKCVIPNPADPMSAFCQTTAVSCPGTKCYTAACNPATGACDRTTIPPPANTVCTTYTCDDKTGPVATQTGACTTTPLCTVENQLKDCTDNNACTDDICVLAVPSEPRTAKCVFTPKTVKDPNFCKPLNGPDLCNTYNCDPAKGCDVQPIPIPADTVCTTYTCNKPTGIVLTPTGACTPTPVCTPPTGAADCDDKNACTEDTCVLAVPSEPRTAKCVNTVRPASFCTPKDACETVACVPASGCVATPLSIPADTTCLDYSCDAQKGIVSANTGKCTTEPLCDDLLKPCNDNNACTDDKCVREVESEPRTSKCVFVAKTVADPKFCTTDDKCVTLKCTPAEGCVSTTNPVPGPTTCETFSCVPADGIVGTPIPDACTDLPLCETDLDCDDKNPCTTEKCLRRVETEPLTSYCQITPLPDTFCSRNDACETYKCNPTHAAYDGPSPTPENWMCDYTPIPVPDDTTCIDYDCEPASGITQTDTGKCSDTVICTVDTADKECDDGNACTKNICFLSVPTEPLTAVCQWEDSSADCNEDDKCFTYACDVKDGCKKTAVEVPQDTTCKTFKCDPAEGIVSTPTGACSETVICTPPTAEVDCDDGNSCTDDTCVLGVATEPLTAKCVNTPKAEDFCVEADLCFTYKCDPLADRKMPCVKTAVPVPDDTVCLDYTCAADKGVFSTDTGACSQTILCTPATEGVDCNDNNACTDDKCVLGVEGEPLTAKCVFTEQTGNRCAAGKTDLCKKYWCDPAKDCVEELLPVPVDTICTAYKCVPETGNVETTDLCPPEPQCEVNSDCDDKNACTVDTCVLSVPTDPLSAKCVWLPKTASECDDKNACTYDSCAPDVGCKHEPVPENLCDDNDACTTDKCDPASTNTTSPCVHTPVVCNTTNTNVCLNVTCHKQQGCLVLDVVCPTTDNCTISGCNKTSGKDPKTGKVTKGGCYVKDAGTCGFPVGIVAGIAAGAVAGIVVAAVCGALLLGGGAAVAYGYGSGAAVGTAVTNNPLYAPLGMAGSNPLHKA